MIKTSNRYPLAFISIVSMCHRTPVFGSHLLSIPSDWKRGWLASPLIGAFEREGSWDDWKGARATRSAMATCAFLQPRRTCDVPSSLSRWRWT
eukprot:scaffold73_cov337-Pavlova_lutheri.AAC.4